MFSLILRKKHGSTITLSAFPHYSEFTGQCILKKSETCNTCWETEEDHHRQATLGSFLKPFTTWVLLFITDNKTLSATG